jgi:hypothetical protein
MILRRGRRQLAVQLFDFIAQLRRLLETFRLDGLVQLSSAMNSTDP